MSHDDEDDKPTVVIDLNALKKQKLKQEEELANIASELEFATPDEDDVIQTFEKAPSPSKPRTQVSVRVILFDFQSDFFANSLSEFPQGPDYRVVKNLNELNQHLKSKSFQIVVFNYDVNPKAVNQLCLQIKQKLPQTKTMIMAKSISPEKAKLHAQTPSGAHGYYQLPIKADKLEKEIQNIQALKKAA